MYGQKKLVDGIHSFSPKRESWAAKPAKDLPDKVTIHFETEQAGILDMKNPRAVIWANVLDLQRKNNKPVYVEIDPETQIITELLVPEASRVMSVGTQGEGDVDVTFFTSQARHYLRRGNPDFQQMLDALQKAYDNKTAILVTATRHDYEIIDVRPLPKAPGAETLGPSSPPPVDPDVSLQRAQELFDLMSSKSCDACNASCSNYPHCIPFKHAYDGCYARAHEMCRLMMAEGEAPEKVWIYGVLHVDTANVHDCGVGWSWHVAPTLMVTTTSGGTAEKYVIDPSTCTTPVTVAAWKALQHDTNATLRYSTWEPFWSDWYSYPESQWSSLGINDPSFSQTNTYLEMKCNFLQQDCVDYGPPPYECPIIKSCYFIVDRSTFSDDEVEAMLTPPNQPLIEAAFYIVVEGFSPQDLGFTAPAMQKTPMPGFSPASGMTVTPVALKFEDPTHLKRIQRLTWAYNVSFTDISAFTAPKVTVTLPASLSTVSSTGYLYLIQQPAPYEIDGETSWLSTDLRVFQIKAGDPPRFGVTIGSDPNGFITQVIANLNSGNTGGQTFENDISVDQQTSRLELSGTVGGTPVFNFAVARVRYRSQLTKAEDVRVFFRLFPAATTSLAYDQGTGNTYRQAPGTVVPLLGFDNNREVTAIPCFAAPRIDSAVTSMTAQPDAPNVQTIPLDAGGAEVVRYFGCWLDINQTQPQFPLQLPPASLQDGPYSSGRISIYDHIRNEHQCLVSEIVFTPGLIPSGATPSVSDKLAQRNLAIVESANPGLGFSRRIPQTFEIRPSKSKQENDELMIDWGNVPLGSVATFYLPGLAANDILLLAARKYRSHRLVRIDEHTLKCDTGGITYLPIPLTDGNLPGMLTLDLPEGIEKGHVFKVVVRQVTSAPQRPAIELAETTGRGIRRIVGSFQITIPVRAKADMLPTQQRLLSNLRWIERAIPPANRWTPVFAKYVTQVAARVDALGADSSKVVPSSSGQWQQAYRTCLLLMLAAILLIVVLVVGAGTQAGGVVLLGGIPVLALLALTLYLWKKKCRPTTCQLLRALLAGSGISAAILGLCAVLDTSTPRIVAMLLVSAGIAAATAIVGWVKGCFRL